MSYQRTRTQPHRTVNASETGGPADNVVTGSIELNGGHSEIMLYVEATGAFTTATVTPYWLDEDTGKWHQDYDQKVTLTGAARVVAAIKVRAKRVIFRVNADNTIACILRYALGFGV